jgi:N-ethylmaleimide reductase
MMNTTKKLLEPVALNARLSLKNRIVMAPMTRAKADSNGNATLAMAEYYAKRADAGLIITEGTVIRPDGTGYNNVPGIYTDDHIAQWRTVAETVHKKGGKIFMQIWHVGRVSHPFFLQGALPISCSATTMKGPVRRSNGLFYGTAREASIEEIKSLIDAYAKAATNAIKAGFDGVEIHGANGYLIDQFLHYHSNLRQDSYGGNPARMTRFVLEVVRACGDAVGYHRLGIRLSPGAYLNEIKGDNRDRDVFTLLLSELNKLSLAYVHTGNFDDRVLFKELDHKSMTQFLRQHYRGNLIACGGYDINDAENNIIDNQFDLLAIGRRFIANPDLINKIKNNEPLDSYNSSMLNTLR